MLQLSNKLQNVPLLSLRVGGQVAVATSPVINPNNLRIEGFYCYDNRKSEPLILLSVDVREQIPEGFVINDLDVLTEQSELVRLKETLSLEFELIGRNVKTKNGRKIGKITDYATDLNSFYVHKLYVAQSLVRNFTGGSLVVDRTQIIEITSKDIIIDDLLKPVASRAPAVS